jgi:hypothetical protein
VWVGGDSPRPKPRASHITPSARPRGSRRRRLVLLVACVLYTHTTHTNCLAHWHSTQGGDRGQGEGGDPKKSRCTYVLFWGSGGALLYPRRSHFARTPFKHALASRRRSGTSAAMSRSHWPLVPQWAPWSGPRPGGLTLRLRDSWGNEVRGWSSLALSG